MKKKPIIAITMGDAAGIGPEIIVKSLVSGKVREWCSPLVVGDFAVLREAEKLVDVSLNFDLVEVRDKLYFPDDTVGMLDLRNIVPEQVVAGKASACCGAASIAYVEKASELALAAKVAAVVTAPINKRAIQMANLPYVGHTELLAQLCGSAFTVMIFVSRQLGVALVTRHIPLKAVSRSLTVEKILKTIRLAFQASNQLGLTPPHLAVAGFNPHAGEGGIIGEEEEKIKPAVALAIQEGIPVEGPFPPDTVFRRAWQGEFNIVVAMYHDQALIPFKLMEFEKGVNVTLGLPFVRTSVDHGTAYDIAGKGVASPVNLVEAVRVATEMVVHAE